VSLNQIAEPDFGRSNGSFLSGVSDGTSSKEVTIGCQRPKRLVQDPRLGAKFPNLSVIICVIVKSILQDGWFHRRFGINALQYIQVVAIGQAQLPHLSLGHKLFKFTPYLHGSSEGSHGAVHNQTVDVGDSQVLERLGQGLLNLEGQIGLFVVGNVLGILAVE